MFPAALLQLIIILVIVGLALWIIQQIPMDAAIARVIRVVVIVVVAIYLLYFVVGLLGTGPVFPALRRP